MLGCCMKPYQVGSMNTSDKSKSSAPQRQAECGSSSLTPDESRQRYEYIADQINRENSLENFRITWTLASNGFLFAALAFIHSKSASDISGRDFFQFALPILGSIFSISGLLGVISAQRQMIDLMRNWRDLQDLRWPRPYGIFPLGGVPALVLPSALTFLLLPYG